MHGKITVEMDFDLTQRPVLKITARHNPEDTRDTILKHFCELLLSGGYKIDVQAAPFVIPNINMESTDGSKVVTLRLLPMDAREHMNETMIAVGRGIQEMIKDLQADGVTTTPEQQALFDKFDKVLNDQQEKVRKKEVERTGTKDPHNLYERL